MLSLVIQDAGSLIVFFVYYFSNAFGRGLAPFLKERGIGLAPCLENPRGSGLTEFDLELEPLPIRFPLEPLFFKFFS